MSGSLIELSGVRKSFGRHEVLRGVELNVPRGSIFGFLGPNGAGKSTTIRIMLGLLQADAGTCRVAGVDSQQYGVEVRRRVGYMAENQTMYGWMTVAEMIAWCANFYATWDAALADELREQMGLRPDAKVGALSKGQTSKLALLLALAHRPELVILDDPALGLDPLARRDFLRDVIVHLQSRNVTVFFSSHLLYEIEPVCDRVAILNDGRIVACEEVETLRARVKRFEFRTAQSPTRELIPGLLDVRRDSRGLSLIVSDAVGARPAIERMSANGVAVSDLTLDEIFEAYVAGRPEVLT